MARVLTGTGSSDTEGLNLFVGRTKITGVRIIGSTGIFSIGVYDDILNNNLKAKRIIRMSVPDTTARCVDFATPIDCETGIYVNVPTGTGIWFVYYE